MSNGYFLDQLGDKIERERKKRNLSQEDLASSSSIDQTYLARIERGKANPTLKVMYKIARGMRIKLYELFQ